MNRLLLGIVIGIGISALLAAMGFDWPGGEPAAASAAEWDVAPPAARQDAPRGPLIVHRPVPHPALVAAGQLFFSLYVLIAQQRAREEPAA